MKTKVYPKSYVKSNRSLTDYEFIDLEQFKYVDVFGKLFFGQTSGGKYFIYIQNGYAIDIVENDPVNYVNLLESGNMDMASFWFNKHSIDEISMYRNTVEYVKFLLGMFNWLMDRISSFSSKDADFIRREKEAFDEYMYETSIEDDSKRMYF